MTQEQSLAGLSGATLFRMGLEALEAGEVAEAVRLLRGAVAQERAPQYLSQLAICLAQQEEDLNESLTLCQEAVKKDPKNSVHFLRLGEIQVYAGRKKEAIRTLRLGLRLEPNPQILALLRAMGARREPVLPFLSRANPINKYLGKVRSALSRSG